MFLIYIGCMFFGWGLIGCQENVNSLACCRNLDDGLETIMGSMVVRTGIVVHL